MHTIHSIIRLLQYYGHSPLPDTIMCQSAAKHYPLPHLHPIVSLQRNTLDIQHPQIFQAQQFFEYFEPSE